MWGNIANLKENLNKIALDVHDEDEDEEDFKIHGSGNEDHSSVSDRRNSYRYAHSQSPVSNGIDSPCNPEIDQYKAEIKRLQESEAEIKKLSINYAALLKDKEDVISRLNQENGSLKQSLDATNAALSTARKEVSKSPSSHNGLKGSGDLSPNRQHKGTAQARNRHAANQLQNGVFSKQDEFSNGNMHTAQSVLSSRGKEKELADLLEEKNRSLASLQASHELQTNHLRMELEKEQNALTNIQLVLQEEQKMNRSLQEELDLLKLDKDKTSVEMGKIQKELNEKLSEIRQLQMNLSRKGSEDVDDNVQNLQRLVATIERENNKLKMEKSELQAALAIRQSSTNKIYPDAPQKEQPSNLNAKEPPSESFSGREEMELSLEKLNKQLKDMQSERDKAKQELKRLKQHLLEKANEESEKMDEDSKIIEELREQNEYQKARILHLENALKQTTAGLEEVKKLNNSELQKSKEIIDDLNKKLANCMRTLDSKNVELLNLQTALGQYFAEIEAKGHLERELALVREESARLSERLKDADQQVEVSRKEKEQILVKLSQAENKQAEGKLRVNKLEEDNGKLRRALEQSMTRLNRMSVDSDFLVDRRIVIKLLVTYFQRNHSKEVLDLIVRMLGFSDEDKQRIGIAQQGAGKGVVRGVLGLPGRLVGGILGGGNSQAEAHPNMASENQSIADLWVDFLLKETEERERRESAENMARSNEDSHGRSPIAPMVTPPASAHRTSMSSFSRSNISPSPNFSHTFTGGNNVRTHEQSNSELSSVPPSSSGMSRLFPNP